MVQRSLQKNVSFSLVDVSFFLAIVGIAYKFVTAVLFHFNESTGGGQYDLLTFLAPLVVLSTFLLIVKNKSVPNRFFAVAFGLLLYGIVVTVVNGIYAAFNLVFVSINILYWITVTYLVYCYKKKYPGKCKLAIWATILLVACFILFLYSVNTASQTDYYENRDVLTNSVYYLLFLMPFVLLLKKKWLRNSALILIFIAVVLSNKRGALVVLLVAWMIWLFLNMHSEKGAKKLSILLLCIVAAIGLYFLFVFLVKEFELPILERFELFFRGEDEGSGRFDVWKSTFEMLKTDDFLYTVLGRGYRAVSVNAMYSQLSESHNDMLQVLVDYGVIGLFMLLWIYKLLVSIALKMRRQGYEHSIAFVVSLIIFFGCAMISQVMIYPYWFLGIAAFWGYTISDFENQGTIEKG